MWTKEHRARQLAFEKRRRYPTDLTDAEWDVRDNDRRIDVSDAMIHLGMGALLLQRIAHPTT